MHNTGVNIEGVTMLLSFIPKSTVLAWCVSQWSSLRWTPLGKEVTECFAVASGSAAWPAACPSGSQTRRSPAGWGCHKLRLWQPPTTENTQNVNEEATMASQAFFLICPSWPHKRSTATFLRVQTCYLRVLFFMCSCYVGIKRYLLWVWKQQEVVEEVFRSFTWVKT